MIIIPGLGFVAFMVILLVRGIIDLCRYTKNVNEDRKLL